MARPNDEQVQALVESGLRLWAVDISMTLLVVAKDEWDAEHEAEMNIGEESFNASKDARRILRHKQIPPAWRGAIPWGLPRECGDMNVEDVLVNLPLNDIELEGAGQHTLTNEDGNG
jgi:hypothetical protein